MSLVQYKRTLENMQVLRPILKVRTNLTNLNIVLQWYSGAHYMVRTHYLCLLFMLIIDIFPPHAGLTHTREDTTMFGIELCQFALFIILSYDTA